MKMQKGFTLIELMIVIAIIGILASIALPAYNSYINKADVRACLAEATGVAHGVTAAVADNDVALLPVWTPSACVAGAAPYVNGAFPAGLTFDFVANDDAPTTITCTVATGVCTD